MDKRLNKTFADLDKTPKSDTNAAPDPKLNITPFEDAAAWAINQKKKK